MFTRISEYFTQICFVCLLVLILNFRKCVRGRVVMRHVRLYLHLYLVQPYDYLSCNEIKFLLTQSYQAVFYISMSCSKYPWNPCLSSMVNPRMMSSTGCLVREGDIWDVRVCPECRTRDDVGLGLSQKYSCFLS